MSKEKYVDLEDTSTYEERVQTALNVMKEASERAKAAGTPLFLNFSGGRDSSCLLLLAQKVGAEVEAIYMSSGLEIPGSIEFVKEQADKYNLKLHITDPVEDYYGDFNYWVKRFGYFPSHGYTYCSSRLKLRPSRAYLRKLYGHKEMYRVNGVRKKESTRRRAIYKNKPPIRKDGDLAGSFIVQPIQEWSSDDVDRFLAENNFEVMKAYDTFGVSGCAYCPFYQVSIYKKILKVYPNIYDKIIELEREIGKPSVIGNRFLGDIKEEFLREQEENKEEG